MSGDPSMTDIAGLVERLSTYRSRNEWGDPIEHTICNDAARVIRELVEALRPFAALGSVDVADAFTGGTTWILVNGERRFGAIQHSDLRRARTILEGLRDE